MHFSDVVDEFHNQNCFAHAGTAEETNFTTLRVRRQKVDNLDACHEDFCFSRLLRERRRITVDAATLRCFNWSFFVNRITGNVHDATKCGRTNWNADWSALVGHFLTTNKTFGRVHSNSANCVLAKVLSNFQNQLASVVVCFQGVQNLWQIAIKLNVDYGADDLGDFSDV